MLKYRSINLTHIHRKNRKRVNKKKKYKNSQNKTLIINPQSVRQNLNKINSGLRKNKYHF